MTLSPRAAVGDDLALLSVSLHSNANQSLYSYRVLTPVLSDLGFFPGQVLTMRALADNEAPEAFAVVAVSVGGRLLLRQFVLPALLITNSRVALNRIGDPPALPGRRQQFDVSCSPPRLSFREPPRTRKVKSRWTSLRA